MAESSLCISGQILQGLKKPPECPAFGNHARPRRRWGRRWFRRKEPVRPIIIMAASIDGSEIPCRTVAMEGSAGLTSVRSSELAPCLARPRACAAGARQRRRMTADLIQRISCPRGNEVLAALGGPGHGQARRSQAAAVYAIGFTTDSFVVRPMFFPGGDIGRWRCMARSTISPSAAPARCSWPRRSSSKKDSASRTCGGSSVRCGRPAKRRGESGHRRHQSRRSRQGRPDLHYDLGHRASSGRSIAFDPCCPAGRPVFVSGTIGDHGIAIMSVREGIEFETVLESDTAPLVDLAQSCSRRVRESAACATRRAAACRAP